MSKAESRPFGLHFATLHSGQRAAIIERKLSIKSVRLKPTTSAEAPEQIEDYVYLLGIEERIVISTYPPEGELTLNLQDDILDNMVRDHNEFYLTYEFTIDPGTSAETYYYRNSDDILDPDALVWPATSMNFYYNTHVNYIDILRPEFSDSNPYVSNQSLFLAMVGDLSGNFVYGPDSRGRYTAKYWDNSIYTYANVAYISFPDRSDLPDVGMVSIPETP